MKKTLYTTLVIVAILIVFFIARGYSAETFDILGALAFLFFMVIGLMIILKKKIPIWLGYVIFIASLFGFLVDIFFVTKTFILGG